MQHAVGRHEINLATGRGWRAAYRLADLLRPQQAALCRVDADHRAIASGDIKPPAIERYPATEPFCPFFILRRQARRPHPAPTRRRERRHGAAGIEGVDLAIGDERDRAQAPARRGAGSYADPPHLGQAVSKREMAEAVACAATGL